MGQVLRLEVCEKKELKTDFFFPMFLHFLCIGVCVFFLGGIEKFNNYYTIICFFLQYAFSTISVW